MAKTYDIFKDLGLVRADNASDIDNNGEAVSLTQSRAQYMEIRLVESSLFGDSGPDKIRISLPYNHDKVISDRLDASIKNQWSSGGNSPFARWVGGQVQNFTVAANEGTESNSIAQFISSQALFEYDAGSTKKTLSVPFIVPLGLASKQELLNGAAKKMRDTFNFLQGLLYPRHGGMLLPPLMQLTIGGMYRSFFGFVTGVDLTPTNNDMFLDPCTMQYFNIVYDGTITFSNLFIYYHGKGNNEYFDIDHATKAVLFGDDPLPERSVQVRDGALAGQFSANSRGAEGVLHYGLSKSNVRQLFRENSYFISPPIIYPLLANDVKNKHIGVVNNEIMKASPKIQEARAKTEFVIAKGEILTEAKKRLNQKIIKNYNEIKERAIKNGQKAFNQQDIEEHQRACIQAFNEFYEETKSNTVVKDPSTVSAYQNKPRKAIIRELPE